MQHALDSREGCLATFLSRARRQVTGRKMPQELADLNKKSYEEIESETMLAEQGMNGDVAGNGAKVENG